MGGGGVGGRPEVPARGCCGGTVKRGCVGADIQQADTVPRREAEEAAIAAGIAAAAAVPVGRGGEHPHAARRHRSGPCRATPHRLTPPRALPPRTVHAVANCRKQRDPVARAPRAPAVKRGGKDGGAVGGSGG